MVSEPIGAFGGNKNRKKEVGEEGGREGGRACTYQCNSARHCTESG